jgi:hypothetical protein
MLLDFDVNADKVREAVIAKLGRPERRGVETPEILRSSVEAAHAPEGPFAYVGPVPASAQVPLTAAAETVLGRAALEALANGRSRVAARDLVVALTASATPLGAAVKSLVESDAAAAKVLRGILDGPPEQLG